MPELDGFAFVERLHENPTWSKIPVVVITGKTLTDEERARLNGFVDNVLDKSSQTREELLETISGMVAKLAAPRRCDKNGLGVLNYIYRQPASSR